jgi:peptide/nickel transport system substrate-binding protein/oligopeptide transport system substrate-binding protein
MQHSRPASNRASIRAFLAASGLAAACLVLTACDGSDQNAVKVVVIGDARAPFASGAHLPLAAGLVRSATAEGLVGLDEEGYVIPALAERWIVTNNGQNYIFRLRDGNWSDGSPVSAESVRDGLQQALEAQKGTPLGLDLAGISDVRAMAGLVVEIRLTHPLPDLLQLLAQPELGPLHHGRGAGPMALERRGQLAILSPMPPEKLGLPPVEGWPVDGWAELARPLSLRGAGGSDAIAAFAAGQADVVLGGTFLDLPRTHRGALGKSGARIDPVAGLFGLLVTDTSGLLATPQMREAIAMAIDRDSLATGIGPRGWSPATRIVSPGMDGDPGLVGERWQDMDLDGRRILAARRLEVWRAGSPGPPLLRIALPDGPGADILFERLSSDFGDIGVSLLRAGKGQPADLTLIDRVARYSRTAWFLDELACRPGPAACSPAADALAARARLAPDDHSAGLLWAQAETMLTQSNVFIPFGAPIRWSLVNRQTAGFTVNRLGIHALMPLAMQGK